MKTFIQILLLFLLLIQISFAQWVQTSGPDYIVVNAFVNSDSSLFAGTSRGVFLSTDNGITWAETNNGLTHTAVNALTLSESVLFAGTEYGVFISSNNGINWTESDSGLPSYTYITSFTASGTHIFAGTQINGVFLSTDNGTSWNTANSGLPNQSGSFEIYALVTIDSSIFAGTTDGIFLSTNNGISWNETSEGLPKLTYDTTRYGPIYSLAFTPNETGGTNIFAGTKAGVFLSTNNGDSWIPSNSGISENTNITHLAASTDASGSSILIASSVMGFHHFEGIYLSINNGMDWIQIGLRNISIGALAISENGANGKNLLAGTYGGIYFSNNSGVDWSMKCFNRPNPRSNITALAISDMNIIAGIFEGIPFDFHGPSAVFASPDDDKIWRPVYCSFDCTINDFAIIPINNVSSNIFAGTSCGVLHSTNNGDTWNFVNDGLTNYNVKAIAISGANIFVGTWWGGVFISTDIGTNWNMVDTIFTENLQALIASDTNLFVGTGNGIFRSTNNGASWIPVNSGLTNTDVHTLCVSKSVTNDINIFAGTSDGIFLSSNNGVKWEAVNNGLINTYIHCFAASGTNIFAGTHDGVYLSTNNGSSWTEVSDGLTNKNISALAASTENIFAGTSTVWFSGPVGQGVWRRPLSEVITSMDEVSLEMPENFILFHNYPNPFNPSTRISWQSPVGSHQTIKVYDVLGNEVATLVNEYKQAGSYEVEWNAEKLSSGVYFYRLQSGNFIQTKKMLLLK